MRATARARARWWRSFAPAFAIVVNVAGDALFANVWLRSARLGLGRLPLACGLGLHEWLLVGACGGRPARTMVAMQAMAEQMTNAVVVGDALWTVTLVN